MLSCVAPQASSKRKACQKALSVISSMFNNGKFFNNVGKCLLSRLHLDKPSRKKCDLKYRQLSREFLIDKR